MSLKDFLLFVGQSDDGKEKPTVFGRLKRILDVMGNPSDTGDNTIFGKQNNAKKTFVSKPIFNITALQRQNTNGSTPKQFSIVFSLPTNATFYALMLNGSNHDGYLKKCQISIQTGIETKTYDFPDLSFHYGTKNKTFFMGQTVSLGKIMFDDCSRSIFNRTNNPDLFTERFVFCESYTIPISDVKKITFSGTLESESSSSSNYTVLEAGAIYSTLN